MKIAGLIRGDRGGLGTLSRLLHHGLGFHRTLTLFRIPCERGEFCSRNTDSNRVAGDNLTVDDAQWLCHGADVLIGLETFYGDLVPRIAKRMGLRVALCCMYECTPLEADWMRYVDVVLCPTGLDLQAAEETPGLSHAKKVLLPVPADCERIKFHQRERAATFVHHYGHQDSGRNGTREIINAWQHVKSPARLILRGQCDPPGMWPDGSRIELQRLNPENYWDLWNDGEGDVYLHTTRHDALSLPIQEALTAGLPVVAASWWPHCDDGERKGYLPPWCQSNAVPVARTGPQRMCREFTAHYVTAPAIAEIVDRIYGEDISAASMEARRWAENRSWEALRGKWLEALS